MFSCPVPLQLDVKPNIYVLALQNGAPSPQAVLEMLQALLAFFFSCVSYCLSHPTAVQAAVTSRSGVPPKHPGSFS